jgi:hypothetical protein
MSRPRAIPVVTRAGKRKLDVPAAQDVMQSAVKQMSQSGHYSMDLDAAERNERASLPIDLSQGGSAATGPENLALARTSCNELCHMADPR